MMPIYAAFFMVFTLASIGLPGTNGFIGEFLILLGTFASKRWAAVLGALGVIIGATYMLRLYQQVFYQEVNPKVAGLPDVKMREVLALVPMLILVLLIGCYPTPFLGFMHASVRALLEHVHQAAGTTLPISEILKEGLHVVLPS